MVWCDVLSCPVLPVPSSLMFYFRLSFLHSHSLFYTLFYSLNNTTYTYLFILPSSLSSSHPSIHQQVVANVKSLDQIGKAGAKDIMDYYVTQFGAVDSPAFKRAQAAFIRSMAGYAVVCYLLRIKVSKVFQDFVLLFFQVSLLRPMKKHII